MIFFTRMIPIAMLMMGASTLLGYHLECNTLDGNFSIEFNDTDQISDIKQIIGEEMGYKVEIFSEGIQLEDEDSLLRHSKKEIWVVSTKGKKNEGNVVYTASVKGMERDYSLGYTKENFNDISYIVKTLSYKSLTQIWKFKGSLESAGERVKNVHPLNFLLCIFENEELKVGIRNIRKRGWVWSDFFNGLRTSIKEEYLRENLTQEMVVEFSNKLEIDANKILPFLQSQDWVELVDTLIEIVPRKGNTDLYGF